MANGQWSEYGKVSTDNLTLVAAIHLVLKSSALVLTPDSNPILKSILSPEENSKQHFAL